MLSIEGLSKKYRGTETYSAENITLEVKDGEVCGLVGSNGAGDAFCAGIIFALHRQLPPEEALRIANVSAWFNLHDATASGGAVSWNKIREKIEKEYASHVS